MREVQLTYWQITVALSVNWQHVWHFLKIPKTQSDDDFISKHLCYKPMTLPSQLLMWINSIIETTTQQLN